jgi:hypothetical protein
MKKTALSDMLKKLGYCPAYLPDGARNFSSLEPPVFRDRDLSGFIRIRKELLSSKKEKRNPN